MSTRRGSVHVGATDGSVFVALVDQILDLLVVGDRLGGGVGDGDPAGNLSDVELSLTLLATIDKQVLKTLHVDLNNSNRYLKGQV